MLQSPGVQVTAKYSFRFLVPAVLPSLSLAPLVQGLALSLPLPLECQGSPGATVGLPEC